MKSEYIIKPDFITEYITLDKIIVGIGLSNFLDTIVSRDDFQKRILTHLENLNENDLEYFINTFDKEIKEYLRDDTLNNIISKL